VPGAILKRIWPKGSPWMGGGKKNGKASWSVKFAMTDSIFRIPCEEGHAKGRRTIDGESLPAQTWSHEDRTGGEKAKKGKGATNATTRPFPSFQQVKDDRDGALKYKGLKRSGRQTGISTKSLHPRTAMRYRNVRSVDRVNKRKGERPREIKASAWKAGGLNSWRRQKWRKDMGNKIQPKGEEILLGEINEQNTKNDIGKGERLATRSRNPFRRSYQNVLVKKRTSFGLGHPKRREKREEGIIGP